MIGREGKTLEQRKVLKELEIRRLGEKDEQIKILAKQKTDSEET